MQKPNPIRSLAAMLFAALFPVLASAQDLPGSLERIANAHGVPVSDIGVIVQELGSDTPLVSVNPGVARNPASVMKMVTTLVALDELGPVYTWDTEVHALGRMRGGTIDGDVGLRGFGDPYLVTEDLWKLVQGLRRRGVDHITGDLVVDDSYFTIPPEDPGAFDNRPFHSYNALPNALLVNFKSVIFHFYAGTNSVDIKLEPELPNLRIENRLKTVGGACRGYQRGIAMHVPKPAVADYIIFEGEFPGACGHYALSRSVLTPEAFAYGVFKSLWEQSGGRIEGSVRKGTISRTSRPILIWHSRSLGEIIRLVNKFSNNVMARNILLTLGAEKFDEPGTVEKGVRAITEYLEGRAIDTSSMVISNGAGLSRSVRIAPRTLADMLLYAERLPFGPEYISSLAIIGMDGTARNKLRKRREAGHAHVKTGTIDHVSAVGGYVNARSGRRFVIVGIVNHNNAHRGPGEQLWNALIRWTFEQ